MGEGCNPNDCLAIARLEHQIEEFRKSNTATHEKLWLEINDLKTNDAVQDSKYDTILKQLNELTSEVKTLQAVPGNNWKDFTKIIGSSIVTLIIGYLFGKLGII